MSIRTTPTLALCLAGALAAGIALARPATDAPSSSAAPAVTTAPADAAPFDTLTIADFSFSPLTVRTGQTITVVNADAAPHTATSTEGFFDTGSLDGGASSSITAPTKAGTYALFCAIHPSMQSQLIVTD